MSFFIYLQQVAVMTANKKSGINAAFLCILELLITNFFSAHHDLRHGCC